MADTTIQKQGEVFISQSEYDALRLAGNLQSNTKYHITKTPKTGVNSLEQMNLLNGDKTVDVALDDGMTINGQARFTYDGGTTKDVPMDIDLPIVAGDGVTIDKVNGQEKVEVKLDTAFTDGKYLAKQTTTISGPSFVYAYDSKGDRHFQITGSHLANTVPIRYTDGRLRVGTAVEDSDAMPKKQVEDGFLAKVPIDSVPTEGSNNLITSGGVFDALSGKLDASKNAVETVGGLVTPMSAPASVSIAAVDTTNAQTMLTIGDGLSVENGVLKATGGGAGSSSGSGVQVQADWNVNNESDPSFIKNKPFGYGSVAVVFRKDSLDEYGGHHGDSTSGYIPHVFFVLGQNELTLVDGETYHVKCSSDQGAVEYAGKARNMGGVFVLGDCILEDGSRNPNFNVAIMVGETYDESNPPNISIAFNDLKADAEDAVPTLTNVSIIIEKCAIKKIPSWFLELPDIKVQTVYMIYKSKYDNGDYNANGSITGKPIYEAVNNGSTIYYVDDSSSGPHFANRYYTMTSIWIADSCGDGNFNIDCTYTSWEYDTSGAYVCKENTLNMGFTNA